MSGTFRIHNSNAGFSIDSTKENAQPKHGRAANSRRPALGNVTNQLRRQPQRVVKGKHATSQQLSSRIAEDQENIAPAGIKGGKVAPAFSKFTIFEDAVAAPAPPPPTGVPVQVLSGCHEEDSIFHEKSLSEHIPVLHEAVADFSRISAPRFCHPVPQLEISHNNYASPMYIDEAYRSHEASLNKPDEFGLDPYFQDIYTYLRMKECASRPNKDYMNRQNDVTTSMRNILVDWLVEVGEEYRLQRETLFLAVNYIDRFLSLVGVYRPKLQLVGAASMFIAAKYEEIYPPDVAEFVYITDDTYTKSQVLKMESVILKMLEFKVAMPTVNWFCERFMDLLDMTDKAKFLSYFLTELSLIEIEEFLVFRPSVVAASAVVIARSVLNIQDPWPKHMEQVSSYSLSDLKPCIKQLFSQYTKKGVMPQQAVIEKYKQEKFARVSTIEPPRVLAVF